VPGAKQATDNGCTACTCSPDGTWGCISDACDDACTPGESRSSFDGCNACYCAKQGTWACTNMVCTPQ
jgi:hypothetical protein